MHCAPSLLKKLTIFRDPQIYTKYFALSLILMLLQKAWYRFVVLWRGFEDHVRDLFKGGSSLLRLTLTRANDPQKGVKRFKSYLWYNHENEWSPENGANFYLWTLAITHIKILGQWPFTGLLLKVNIQRSFWSQNYSVLVFFKKGSLTNW